MRILVVEDEPGIGGLVQAYLQRDGHDADWVRTGREALARLQADAPDLIVLDLGLPDLDGLAVARAAAPRTPVVVLTARGEEPDRMAGFAAGVDDYVVKPFSPRELVARVRAVLRRAGAPAEDLVLGDLTVSPERREVRLDGDPVELAPREFALLAHLVARPGIAFSRERLLEEVWGLVDPGETRTVDVHVAQLRAKLGRPELIRTVRGVGYAASRT